MASQDVRINLATIADFVVTNLHGVGDSDVWQSGDIDDAEPHHDQVTISYRLIGNANVAADDQINFFWVDSDEVALNEIRTAAVGPGEGVITVANEISDIEDACDLVHSVRIDRVNQTIEGSFIVFSPGPSWQLLIQVVTAAALGGLAVANNIVRYRLGTPQIQP